MPKKDEVFNIVSNLLKTQYPDSDTSEGSEVYQNVIAPLMKLFGEDDFSVDVERFINTRLKQEIPDLNINEGDALTDLLVKPNRILLEPIRRELEKVKINQAPIRNYEVMTEDEVDASMDNWFVSRPRGGFGSGIVVVKYKNPISESFSPSDTVTSVSGKVFHPVSYYDFLPEDMLVNRGSDGLFFIELPVVAEERGSDGNIGEDEIVSIDGHPAVFSVTNPYKFKGGSNSQSVGDFIDWSRNSLTERSLTTSPGIKARLRDALRDDLLKVEIVGHGDVEMKRDVIEGEDTGITIAGGLGVIIGKYLLLMSVWQDRGQDSTLFPTTGDKAILSYSPPLYSGIPNNDRVESLAIIGVMGDTVSMGYPANDIPPVGLYILESEPKQSSMTVTPFLPRVHIIPVIIKKPGSLKISGIPGGISSDDSGIIDEGTVHIGGHYDVWAKPAFTNDSTLRFDNIKGYNPVVNGAKSLDTYGLTSNPSVVRDNSGRINFNTANIKPGDYLLIEEGPDAGSYKILSAWGYELVLDSELTQSATGLKYSIYRDVEVDLTSGKRLKFPESGSNLKVALSSYIGNSEYRSNVDIRNAGGVIGDIIEVDSGPIKGSYRITAWGDQGGRSPILDKPASQTTQGSNFKVYEEQDSANLPLIRVKSLELVNENGEDSGIKVPYALPIESRSLGIKGSNLVGESNYGFVMPDLQTILQEDRPCKPPCWPSNWNFPPDELELDNPIWNDYQPFNEVIWDQISSNNIWPTRNILDQVGISPPCSEWPPQFNPDGKLLIDLNTDEEWYINFIGDNENLRYPGDVLEWLSAENFDPAAWGLPITVNPEEIIVWNPIWARQGLDVGRSPYCETLKCGGSCSGPTICIGFDDGRQYEVCLPEGISDGKNNLYVALPEIPWVDLAVWFYNSFLNPGLLFSLAVQADLPPQIPEANLGYQYDYDYLTNYWPGYYAEPYGVGYQIYYSQEPWYQPDQPQPAYDIPKIPIPPLCKSNPGDVLTIKRGENAGSYRIKSLYDIPINFGFYANKIDLGGSLVPQEPGYYAGYYGGESAESGVFSQLFGYMDWWFLFPGGVWLPNFFLSQNPPEWPTGRPPKYVWEKPLTAHICMAEIECEFPKRSMIQEGVDWLCSSGITTWYSFIEDARTQIALLLGQTPTTNTILDQVKDWVINTALNYFDIAQTWLESNVPLFDTSFILVTGRNECAYSPYGSRGSIGAIPLTETKFSGIDQAYSTCDEDNVVKLFTNSNLETRFDRDSVSDASVCQNLSATNLFLVAYAGERWESISEQANQGIDSDYPRVVSDIGFKRSVLGSLTLIPEAFENVSQLRTTVSESEVFSSNDGLLSLLRLSGFGTFHSKSLSGLSNPKILRDENKIVLFFIAHYEDYKVLMRCISEDIENKKWEEFSYVFQYSESESSSGDVVDIEGSPGYHPGSFRITGFDIHPDGGVSGYANPVVYITTENVSGSDAFGANFEIYQFNGTSLTDSVTSNNDVVKIPVSKPWRLGSVQVNESEDITYNGVTTDNVYMSYIMFHEDVDSFLDNPGFGEGYFFNEYFSPYGYDDLKYDEFVQGLGSANLERFSRVEVAFPIMNDGPLFVYPVNWAVTTADFFDTDKPWVNEIWSLPLGSSNWDEYDRWASDVIQVIPDLNLEFNGFKLPSTRTGSFWLLALALEAIIMNRGIFIPELGWNISISDFSSVIKDLLFTGYSVGKPSEGVVRTYFLEPTTFTAFGGCNLDHNGNPKGPTKFLTTVNEEPVEFAVDGGLRPHPIIPADGSLDPDFSEMPRDLSVVDKYAGAVQLTDITRPAPIELEIDPLNDRLEVHREIFMNYYYGPWNIANGIVPINQSICGVICRKNSAVVKIPENCAPKFMPSIKGSSIFIEEGPNKGNYKVSKWLGPKEVELDRPLLESTYAEDNFKSDNIILVDIDTEDENFDSNGWYPSTPNWEGGKKAAIRGWGYAKWAISTSWGDGSTSLFPDFSGDGINTPIETQNLGPLVGKKDIGKWVTVFGTRGPAAMDGSYKIVAVNLDRTSKHYGMIVVDRDPWDDAGFGNPLAYIMDNLRDQGVVRQAEGYTSYANFDLSLSSYETFLPVPLIVNTKTAQFGGKYHIISINEDIPATIESSVYISPTFDVGSTYTAIFEDSSGTTYRYDITPPTTELTIEEFWALMNANDPGLVEISSNGERIVVKSRSFVADSELTFVQGLKDSSIDAWANGLFSTSIQLYGDGVYGPRIPGYGGISVLTTDVISRKAIPGNVSNISSVTSEELVNIITNLDEEDISAVVVPDIYGSRVRIFTTEYGTSAEIKFGGLGANALGLPEYDWISGTGIDSSTLPEWREVGMAMVHAPPEEEPTIRSEGGTELVGVAPFRAYEEHPTLYDIDYVSQHLNSFEAYMLVSRTGSNGQERYISSGYRMPYRIVRPGVRQISSTKMADNYENGLYYVDIKVYSLGSGDQYNLNSKKRLEPVISTYDSDGYYYETDDTRFAFSTEERLKIVLSPKFLPEGRKNRPDNFIPTLGRNWKIRYEHSSLVSFINNLLRSRAERAPASNPLARHFLPSYLIVNIEYSGPEPDVIAEDIKSLIDKRGSEIPITVYELEKIITKRGGSYVKHPTELISITLDLDRRFVADRSEDMIGNTDQPYFNGTNRIMYLVNGESNANKDETELPVGTKIILNRVVRR